MDHHPEPPMPTNGTISTSLGGVAAALGAVMAQSDPNASVGKAGILIGLTGLVGALYPWFKLFIESKQQGQKIAEMQKAIQRGDERRHKLRDDASARINTMQVQMDAMSKENVDLRIEAARLRAASQVIADNVERNTKNIDTLADHTRPPIPVQHSPVSVAEIKPILGHPLPLSTFSDDDEDAFVDRSPQSQ